MNSFKLLNVLCNVEILCSYLVNTKKLPYEQAYKILKIWLEKCNKLRKLDFNPNTEIKVN